MSRDESTRQSVLARDGRRCQVCGKSEGIEVHHIQPLGLGGSEERDVAANMITLCSECHGKVHTGMLHIEKYAENELAVTDGESRQLPKAEIWLYRRKDAEMLEKEIDLVRTVQMVESQHAKVIAHIWRNYQLISDAASPAQFIAGLGLDSNRAKDEARAAQWIEDNGLTWPDGTNLKKILLLISAGKELAHAQVWLDQSADASYSDLRRALVKKGLKLATMRWYLLIEQLRRPLGRMQTDVLFVRSRDIEVVMARKAPEVKVLEINAFRSGIKWDRRAQKLFDGDGREIPFETWEKEANDT